jgi:uncharacterized protein YutD
METNKAAGSYEDGEGKSLIHIGGRTYEIVIDHRNAYNFEAFRDRYSEVLERYDYIVGDWGYNQLRLKGFFKESNQKSTRDTSVASLSDYLNEYCNFGCAYFVLERNNSKNAPKPPQIASEQGQHDYGQVQQGEDQSQSQAQGQGQQTQAQPQGQGQPHGQGQSQGQGQTQGQDQAGKQGRQDQGHEGKHEHPNKHEYQGKAQHHGKHEQPNKHELRNRHERQGRHEQPGKQDQRKTEQA